MTTLERLWTATDAHLAVCPPPLPQYEGAGMHWLAMLSERGETHPPKGCPEVAANTMLRLEQALRHTFDVTYQRPVCNCGRTHHEAAKGSFSPARNLIFVQPDDPRRMFATMVHETAHALTHRPFATLRLDEEAQEVIVESTACEVLGRFGLDTVEGSAAYIAGYTRSDGTDPREFTSIVMALANKIEQMIQEGN